MFSFNNPYGACPKCTGIGSSLRVDPELIMPNAGLSIRNGAIKASGWNYAEGTIAAMYIDALAEKHGFSVDQPVSELSDEAVNEIMYGTHGEKILIKQPETAGAEVSSIPISKVSQPTWSAATPKRTASIPGTPSKNS